MRDRRHPRRVVRARPGCSCKAIHDAEFGVGDSYQVVWSERDIFMAWGHLAGSGMLLLPAIAAGPRRGGRGHSECPIQVTTHRFGVAPSGYVCVCACARVRVYVCVFWRLSP